MAQVTVNIDISSSVMQAVRKWRDKQLVDDGTGNMVKKYPNNMSLLRDIIKQSLQRIVEEVPTTDIEVELQKIRIARDKIRALKDGVVS